MSGTPSPVRRTPWSQSAARPVVTPEGRAALGNTEGVFRVSVGNKDFELLKSEFTKAIAASQAV